MYQIITPRSANPVTLADARLHLKKEDDQTSEDSLIGSWITAATEFAQWYIEQALGTQTLEMPLDAFPTCRYIDLDLPPVASITSIKYTDETGSEQTLGTDKYTLSPYGLARRVNLTYGNEWPVAQLVAEAVRVRYVTGTRACPQAVRDAILLIVGHLDQNRQEVVVDLRVAAQQVPMGAIALLDTVKVWSV